MLYLFSQGISSSLFSVRIVEFIFLLQNGALVYFVVEIVERRPYLPYVIATVSGFQKEIW